jgi:hypothetical protein
MPTSARSELVNKNSIPGPGTYTSSVKADGPFYSLKGRTRTLTESSYPGPGNYNPIYEATLEKVPGFRLGSSKRTGEFVKTFTPGPGKYDPILDSATPNINFGKSSRSVSYENSMPGPGSYSIKEEKLGYAYSMTPRRTPALKQSTPGPGSYASFIKSSSPNYSVSKSERKASGLSSDSPGPGSYNPEPPKSQGHNSCTSHLGSVQLLDLYMKSKRSFQGLANTTQSTLRQV